jgi:anti-sigma factor RsiW
MQERRYTDEELSAWVDGEGTAGERAGIDAWLRAHPDEAARVQAWLLDRDVLREAYADVAHEALPARLVDTVRAGSAPAHGALPALARWPAWGLAAAAAGLFLLGAVAGGFYARQWPDKEVLARAGSALPAPQGWLQRAAFAHSVYTPEPRHAVEVKAQEEHLARWLTRRIEAPVKLFDLRPLGFELVGGRLLPDGAGKSAQLMYQNGNGKRVTVYLRKPEAGTDTAFRYEQQGALGMFYWVDEKTGFALVGELPKEKLLALARSIYDQDATLPAPSLTPPPAASAPVASPPAPAPAPAPAASLPPAARAAPAVTGK